MGQAISSVLDQCDVRLVEFTKAGNTINQSRHGFIGSSQKAYKSRLKMFFVDAKIMDICYRIAFFFSSALRSRKLMTRLVPSRLANLFHGIRATLTLALPLTLTNVAPFLFSITNLGILGRSGTEELAAGALSFGLFNLSLSLLSGIDAAAMALFSQAVGRRIRVVREIRQIMRHALATTFASCGMIWLVLWYCEPLLIAFGQDPMIAAGAASIMRVLMWALLPYMLFKLLRAFLGSRDRQVVSLTAVLLGMILNGALAFVLIRGEWGMPRMGLAGAGVAVLMSSCFMALFLAVLVSRGRRFQRLHLFSSRWTIERMQFTQLLGLSIPVTMALFFENAVFYGAMIVTGYFGTVQLAAHSVTMQFVSLAFKLPAGLGQAATIRVARACGARNFHAAGQAGWTAFGVTLFFAVIASLLMLLYPRALIAMFMNTALEQNAPVIAYATQLLFLAGVFQLADATQGVVSGMLRGLRDAKVPMMLAGIGYWVLGLPIGLVLAFQGGLQGRGVWMGLALGLSIVALSLTLRWRRQLAILQLTAAS